MSQILKWEEWRKQLRAHTLHEGKKIAIDHFFSCRTGKKSAGWVLKSMFYSWTLSIEVHSNWMCRIIFSSFCFTGWMCDKMWLGDNLCSNLSIYLLVWYWVMEIVFVCSRLRTQTAKESIKIKFHLNFNKLFGQSRSNLAFEVFYSSWSTI